MRECQSTDTYFWLFLSSYFLIKTEHFGRQAISYESKTYIVGFNEKISPYTWPQVQEYRFAVISDELIKAEPGSKKYYVFIEKQSAGKVWNIYGISLTH